MWAAAPRKPCLLAGAPTREPSAIVGVDIAPRLAISPLPQRRPKDLRVSFRVGDAAALDLPDRAFDRSFSLLALNFVREPALAVREMRRATRLGGTVAASIWDFVGGLTYQRVFWDTAAAREAAASQARACHYATALTWPGELEIAFADAGLRDIVMLPAR